MSKSLSFKMGTSGNRNIANGTRVGPNGGQVIFDYNSILNGENNFYPYADYQINGASAAQKPKYDVKVYLDIDDENRIPLTTKFSDYSSKLWNLSTGTEFNCGDNGQPVFFSNGVPCPTQFKIETINRATLGITPNTFKVSIDATHDNQAIVKLPCNFGICSTAGNTIAKTVTVDISSDTPFVLGNGIKVAILFQNGNTSGLSNVTLNVNGTGAKKIKIGNSSNLSTNFIKSGQICHFTYYNNYWYLDSSPEATTLQNGLLSINSQQIKGQKDFLDKVLLRNGFEFRGPSAVPLASLSGSNIGDSENGLVTLTLGSIATAADQGKGCIKLYNNKTKTTTLTTYSSDTDTSNQTIYFRNYGSADNFFVTTNTPARLGGSEDTNGDKPVYISDKGVATECDGIVVTGLAQSFDGNKTFTGNIIINSKSSSYIDNFHQCDDLCISGNNQDLRKKLYLDPQSITAIDNTNDTITSSTLYLNGDGGDIGLGPQILISTNKIQSIQNINASSDNYIFNDLYLNSNGASTHIGKSTPIEITEEGIVKITNTTEASSSATGALVVAGGIGVAKTSYMASILPNTTMSSQLGGFDNVWRYVFSNEYLIHDGTNGHFNNSYTGGKIYTETGASSSGSSCYTYIELGNRLSEDEYEGSRAGALTIYGPKKGGVTIETRSDHGNYVRTFYLPSESSSQYAVWSNKEDTSVGGMTYLADGTSNGHEPVYVTAAGRVYPCGGIVVTEGDQTFTGSKTFNTQLIINNGNDISLSTISEAAFIIKNSQYTMGFDSNEILVSKADGTSSVLYLNDGGEVQIDGTFHLQQAGNYGSTLPDTNLRAGRVFFKIID